MTNQVFRMCVQTRKIHPREQLVRLVVSSPNVVIDNQYEVQGRSIYILDDIETITKFLSRKKLPIRLDQEKQQQVKNLLGEYINEK